MSTPRPNLVTLAIWPLLLLIYLFVTLQIGGFDELVSQWFYNPLQHRFPLQDDHWLRDVLHDGGHAMMVDLLLAIIGVWLLSYVCRRLAPYRRSAAYLAVSILLGVTIVNLGKQLTNMDCPWDLEIYGGERPRTLLFEAKPASVPRGHCFPGGHSSSGFALFGLYFLSLARGVRRPWPWLLPALLLGGTFSVTQWARGAHFPSHDLVSAYLCWLASLATYAMFFGPERGGGEVRAPTRA